MKPPDEVYPAEPACHGVSDVEPRHSARLGVQASQIQVAF